MLQQQKTKKRASSMVHTSIPQIHPTTARRYKPLTAAPFQSQSPTAQQPNSPARFLSLALNAIVAYKPATSCQHHSTTTRAPRMQMGEPAEAEEPAVSLHRVPTGDCDHSIAPSHPPPPPPVPTSLTEPPPPQATEPGDEHEDETQVADAQLLPHETPDIKPSTTDPPLEELELEDGENDKEEALQNDASSFTPKSGCTENRAIEFQREQDSSNMKRDSGLASIMDSESLQQTTTTTTPDPVTAAPVLLSDPATALQEIDPGPHESEKTIDPDMEAVATPQTASAAAMQSVKHASIVAADTRSIAAGSIGGRSLVAPSTISREDEMLSLKVRSLYDSGFGTLDGSGQFSDVPQRRIFSIIEEGAAAGVSRIRGTRSSFPGASKEMARRNRLSGSVEGSFFKPKINNFLTLQQILGYSQLPKKK